jgi:hypothetical protein
MINKALLNESALRRRENKSREIEVGDEKEIEKEIKQIEREIDRRKERERERKRQGALYGQQTNYLSA